MRLEDWLLQTRTVLAEAGIESARLEAEVLAARALGCGRSWVLAHPEHPVEPNLAEVEVGRRRNREPLAYILGEREFFGRTFLVNPSVLIPRQETETLVEAVLGSIPRGEPAVILDVGTGSGCIAISLQLQRPEWKVWALDRSAAALRVAIENARRLGALGIRFLESDLFDAVPDLVFDLIVSNPPYVASGADLMPEVANHEPKEALFAGADGIEIYASLAEQAWRYLKPGGLLLVEIGDAEIHGQPDDGIRSEPYEPSESQQPFQARPPEPRPTEADRVRRVFESSGWRLSRTFEDLSGHTRVLAFCFAGDASE